MKMNRFSILKRGVYSAGLGCCLAGSAVATEYDLYLVAGQSNCDGRGATNNLSGRLEGWAGEQTNVLINYTNPRTSDPQNPTYQTGWTNLMPGFAIRNKGEALPSERFGPEISFGKMMADSFPNRNIALIKVSRGGTNVSSDWSPSGNGYMWQTFTNQVTQAMQELTDAGHTLNLKGMIWHQGESDLGRTSAEFSADLTAFLAAARSLVGNPELPVVVGELTNLYAARTIDLNAVAAVDPYTEIVSATKLTTNLVSPLDTHFDALSLLALGQRYGAAIQNFPFTSELIENETVVFFGDSITQKGVLENGYVTLFADAVASNFPSGTIDVIGAGVSGNKMADLQARLDADVLSFNPTIVVIYTGINDVWHWTKPDPKTGLPREGTTAVNYEAGLSNLVQRIEVTGARVVLCTPTVISEQANPNDANYVMLEEFSALTRSVAAEAGCQLVDLRSLFTDYLLLNNTSDASSGILTADTVHLNDAGNQLLADALEDALMPTRPELGPASVSLEGSSAVLNWNGSAEASYSLLRRTNMTAGSWALLESTDGVDGTNSFTHQVDGPVSFYRIIGH